MCRRGTWEDEEKNDEEGPKGEKHREWSYHDDAAFDFYEWR